VAALEGSPSHKQLFVSMISAGTAADRDPARLSALIGGLFDGFEKAALRTDKGAGASIEQGKKTVMARLMETQRRLLNASGDFEMGSLRQFQEDEWSVRSVKSANGFR
jgi:hypothetical protein